MRPGLCHATSMRGLAFQRVPCSSSHGLRLHLASTVPVRSWSYYRPPGYVSRKWSTASVLHAPFEEGKTEEPKKQRGRPKNKGGVRDSSDVNKGGLGAALEVRSDGVDTAGSENGKKEKKEKNKKKAKKSRGRNRPPQLGGVSATTNGHGDIVSASSVDLSEGSKTTGSKKGQSIMRRDKRKLDESPRSKGTTKPLFTKSERRVGGIVQFDRGSGRPERGNREIENHGKVANSNKAKGKQSRKKKKDRKELVSAPGERGVVGKESDAADANALQEALARLWAKNQRSHDPKGDRVEDVAAALTMLKSVAHQRISPMRGAPKWCKSEGRRYRPEFVKLPTDDVTGDYEICPSPGFEELDISQYSEKAHYTLAKIRKNLPRLQHRLESVLISPGIHTRTIKAGKHEVKPFGDVRDIPQPDELFWENVPPFVPPAKDKRLQQFAKTDSAVVAGSSSSVTGILAKFVLFLTNRGGPDLSWLSSGFYHKDATYTKRSLGPVAVVLRRKPGHGTLFVESSWYGSDTILSKLGHSVELLLTESKEGMQNFLRSAKPSSVKVPQSYQYTKIGGVTLRSQLDGHSPHLPKGEQVFDIKARAISAIRYSMDEYMQHRHRTLRSLTGSHSSYEREFYDLTRSAMLKFFLQARIGNMGGMFMAYHNTQHLLGFEYLPRTEMANIIFDGPELAERSYKICLAMLERTLATVGERYASDEAIAVVVHRSKPHLAQSEFLDVFAYPIPNDVVQADLIIHAAVRDPLNKKFRATHWQIELQRFTHPSLPIMQDQRLTHRHASSLKVAMKIEEKPMTARDDPGRILSSAWFDG